MLVCVQLSGQLDPNSAVEIVLYGLPNTAIICEFCLCHLFFPSTHYEIHVKLSCTPMHLFLYIQHWTIL